MNNLADKDLLNDLLTSEKQVMSAYSVGISESSCTNLRNTLVDNFKKVQDLQYKIFDTMQQKGWYATKDAAPNEVEDLKNKSNQMMNELK